MTSIIERKLTEQIRERIRDVTPGVLVRAYQGGKMVVDVSVGETWAYYDFASLTKMVFTLQAMMVNFEEGRWNLNSTVGDFLDWYPHPNIKITDLMSHSAGMQWWAPIYKELDLTKDVAFRRQQLQQILRDMPVHETAELSVYSDIGYLLLGFVLEKMEGLKLYEIWIRIKELFYDGTTLDFHPGNENLNRPTLYAPTEECPWRGKLLRGEVHDENTWALGGVSTHSGLFGSIDDAGWALLNLRSQMLGIGRSPVRSKTAKIFTTRARPEGKGDWALGLMLPTPGSASCGSHFALNSVGHTGFTGTSLWYDPKADLAVAILSNRVMYGRENHGFKVLRPEIHNWIVDGLRKAAF